MPLFEFRCLSGHLTELLRPSSAQTAKCVQCGEEAVRAPVMAFSRPPRMQGWGSDFEMTPAMRAAHDEAVGQKREAQKIAREYVENGYKVSQER